VISIAIVVCSLALMTCGWYAALGKRKNYFGATAVVAGAIAASITISHVYAGVPVAHPYWVIATIWSSVITLVIVEKTPTNAPSLDKIGAAWVGTMLALGGSTAAGIHTGPLANAFGLGMFVGLAAFALLRWIAGTRRGKRA